MKINIQSVTIQKTPALAVVWASVEISLVNYQLGGHEAVIYFKICDAQGGKLDDGNITLGATVVDTWGTDDNVLVNAVLSQLGVTRL